MELLHGQRRVPSDAFRQSTTFDSALNFDECRAFIDGEDDFPSKTFDRELVRGLREQGVELKTDVGLWASWMYRSMTSSRRTDHKTADMLKSWINISLKATQLQEEHLLSSVSSPMKDHVGRLKDEWKNCTREIPSECILFLDNAKIMKEAVDKSLSVVKGFEKGEVRKIHEDSKSDMPRSYHRQGKIGWGWNICIIYGDETYILPKIYGYMMFYKNLEAFNSLLSVHLRATVDLPGDAFPLYVSFLGECAKIIHSLGNEGFDMLKSIEGVAIGKLIAEADGFDTMPVLEELYRDMQTPQWCLRGSIIEHVLNVADQQVRTDILGMIKLVGHPDTSLVAGCAKVYARSVVEKELDWNHIFDLRCLAIQKFCEGYYRRKGTWPPLLMKPGLGKRLETAILRNWSLTDNRIAKAFPEPDLREWGCLEFETTEPFTALSTIIPLLKDKSTSPLRADALSYYSFLAGVDGSYIDKPWQEKRKISNSTRLLVHYLLSTNMEQDVKNFLTQFEIDPELVLDFLTIKLTAKEKELKKEPRMFGLTTPENRTRMLLTSMNLFGTLRRYYPEQAFTLSKTELLEKMLAMKRVAHLSLEAGRMMFTHIDSTGWNSAYRSQLVIPLAQILDAWHGTGLYSLAQPAFEQTQYISPGYQKVVSWQGQLGGIEGLEQPLWSWIYGLAIDLGLSELRYRHHGLIKGDDAKYGVVVPETDIELLGRDTIVNRLATEIQASIRRIGQEGKVSETFVSERFLTFGKKWCLDEIFLPNMTKSLAKAHGYGEAPFPTLSSRVGTTFANCHSACGEGTLHVIPYILGCVNSLWHIHHTELDVLTEDQKATYLMWPSCLGGSPVLYLSNFFINSESDQLTQVLSLANFIEKVHPEFYVTFRSVLSVEIMELSSPISLAKDPYSVPVKKPREASALLRSKLSTFIARVARQPQVKILFASVADSYASELDTYLRQMSVYNAKAMNALYGSSIAGLRDDYIAKFETSSSIFSFFAKGQMRRYESRKISNELAKAEREVLTWRKKILTAPPSLFSIILMTKNQCSTKWATDLRERAWGKPVLSVTYPHPSEQISGFNPMHTDPEEEFGETIMPSECFKVFVNTTGRQALRTTNHHYTSGIFKPFLGKVTSEGTAAPAIRLEDHAPSVTKVLGLLKLNTFMNIQGSDFHHLIRHALSYLTTYSLEELQPFSYTKVRGTTTHRLRARGFKEKISINEYPNRMSLVKGDSSYNTDRNPREDVTINYLELMNFEFQMALYPLEYNHLIRHDGVFHFFLKDCPDCQKSVDDIPVKLSNLPGKGFPLPEGILTVGLEERKVIENALEELGEAYTIGDMPAPDQIFKPDLDELVLMRFWDENRVNVSKLEPFKETGYKTHDVDLLSSLYSSSATLKKAEQQRLVTLSELTRITPQVIATSILRTFHREISYTLDNTVDLTEFALTKASAVIAPGIDYMWKHSMGPMICHAITDIIEGCVLSGSGVHSSVPAFLSALRNIYPSIRYFLVQVDVPRPILHGLEGKSGIEMVFKSVWCKAVDNFLSDLDPISLETLDKKLTPDSMLQQWFEMLVDPYSKERTLELITYLYVALFTQPETPTTQAELYEVPVRMTPRVPTTVDSDLEPVKPGFLVDTMLIARITPQVVFSLMYYLEETNELPNLDDCLAVLARQVQMGLPLKRIIPLQQALYSIKQYDRLGVYQFSLVEHPIDTIVPGQSAVKCVPSSSSLVITDLKTLCESTPLTESSAMVPVTVSCIPESEDFIFTHFQNMAYRAHGASTSGVGEIVDLALRTKITISTRDHKPSVACLGDGNGGASTYFSKTNKDIRVFYQNPPVDMASFSESVEGRASTIPALFLESRGAFSNVDMSWASSHSGDLTDYFFWEKVFSGRQWDFVVMTPDATDEQLRTMISYVCKYNFCVKDLGTVAIGIRETTLEDTDIVDTCLDSWVQIWIEWNAASHACGRHFWLMLQSPKVSTNTSYLVRPADVVKIKQWMNQKVAVDPVPIEKRLEVKETLREMELGLKSRAVAGLQRKQRQLMTLLQIGYKDEDVIVAFLRQLPDHYARELYQNKGAIPTKYLSAWLDDLTWLSWFLYWRRKNVVHSTAVDKETCVEEWKKGNSVRKEFLNYFESCSVKERDYLIRNTLVRYIQMCYY